MLAEVLVSKPDTTLNRSANNNLHQKVHNKSRNTAAHQHSIKNTDLDTKKENLHYTQRSKSKRPHKSKRQKMEQIRQNLFLPLNVDMNHLQDPHQLLFRSLSTR